MIRDKAKQRLRAIKRSARGPVAPLSASGMYVSPHLLSYTERMQIDGQTISEQDFADSIAAARAAADKMVAGGAEQPTQFEILTAAAFWYFKQQSVEYAVIEVGLGGLLDSTNVITPEVSVITNVTMKDL